MARPQGILSIIIIFLISAGILQPPNAYATRWMYKQATEKLTDQQYSFAAGIAFDYEYNNDFTVSFQCTGGKVRFEIDVDTLITSKGKEFTFAYRVDKREPRQLTLRTFSNENQGGYTYDNVQQIAKDIFGGNKMFVRVITWDNDYLEARISLTGSDSAIRKVFSDCGVNLDSSTQKQKASYSLSDFTTSFWKLTPTKQQKVLKELQELMKKY